MVYLSKKRKGRGKQHSPNANNEFPSNCPFKSRQQIAKSVEKIIATTLQKKKKKESKIKIMIIYITMQTILLLIIIMKIVVEIKLSIKMIVIDNTNNNKMVMINKILIIRMAIKRILS